MEQILDHHPHVAMIILGIDMPGHAVAGRASPTRRRGVINRADHSPLEAAIVTVKRKGDVYRAPAFRQTVKKKLADAEGIEPQCWSG